MIRMVADPKLPSNDRRHALGGPDIPTEAKRLGPLGQHHRHLRPLLVRQFRRWTWRDAPLQRLDSTLTTASHPLADCSCGDPQGLSNRLLAPPLRLQRPRPQPTALSPVGWPSFLPFHTSHRCTHQTTFSCPRGDQ
jgi:hypothetical protein